MSDSRRTYNDFLNALLVFETTIDSQKAKYYTDNYNTPGVVTYQNVEYPGRVVRAQNGEPTSSSASVKEYFQRLGIDHLYAPGSSDQTMFTNMQFAVLNYLGFVGYQFSEQDLWNLDYYTHYDANGLPMYYSDVPVSNWANGVRDKVMDLHGKGKVHITDVNTWKGTFTGKHNINNFSDVMDPTKQGFIVRDHFDNKYSGIVSLLAVQGKALKDYLGTVISWSECHPVLQPPVGVLGSVTITMSGLLGGAHLRGTEGVAALLLDRENRVDENDTAILQYVYQFGGYDTPYN